MRLDSLLQIGGALDWESLLVRHLWQVSLLVVMVFIAAKYVCHHRPHFAYLLWVLVLLKAVTPPVIATPISPWTWLAKAKPSETAIVNQTHCGSTVEPTTPTVSSHEATQSPSLSPGHSALGINDQVILQSRTGKWLICIWLLGIAGWGAAFFAKWLRLRKQIADESELADTTTLQLIYQQAATLHVRRKFQVRVTSSLGPGVFGAINPQLLLPKQLVDNSDLTIIKPIIAHELIHIRRGDTITGFFQAVVQTLWWFHPLVWLANREARNERERCCDCEVIAHTSHRPIDYARSLVSAIESRNVATQQSIPSLVGITNGDMTARRLTEIIRRGDNIALPRPIAYRMFVAICVLLILPSGPLRDSLHAEDAPLQPPTRNTSDKNSEKGTQREGPAQFGVRNAPPVVVQTIPAAGSTDVDPATTQIQVTFSKSMTNHSWSWVRLDQDSFPTIIGEPRYLESQRDCVVDVKLEPNKTYAIWLNHNQFGNFRDAAGQSAIPYLLAFKTRSD